MSGAEYQGYTNYETFLIGEWIRNDERIGKIWKARTLQIRAEYGEDDLIRDTLGWALKTWMDGHLEGATKAGAIIYDLANAGLGEVDWIELAEELVHITDGSIC